MCALFQPRAGNFAAAPSPVPSQFSAIDGAEIAASTQGGHFSGDHYDSLRVGPERVLFGSIDIAGRRADNQQILDAAQNIFRTVGTELFSRADMNEAEAMTELCIKLNLGIMEAAGGVRSCPAFVGCYHENFGTLCYTNAGHTPGLLRDGTDVVELASTGLPLGLFSHATWEAPTVALEKGAVVLLVSRGVVEGESKDDKNPDPDFGLSRVKLHLQADRSRAAQAFCVSILNEVGEFASERADHKDYTALALLRTP
jgi:serine phosphatase RsbU (regulator of sigma subunit)